MVGQYRSALKSTFQEAVEIFSEQNAFTMQVAADECFTACDNLHERRLTGLAALHDMLDREMILLCGDGFCKKVLPGSDSSEWYQRLCIPNACPSYRLIPGRKRLARPWFSEGLRAGGCLRFPSLPITREELVKLRVLLEGDGHGGLGTT